MVNKYSNLSNFNTISVWMKKHPHLLNQTDEDNTTLIGWILDGYRGKNQYKLALISEAIDLFDSIVHHPMSAPSNESLSMNAEQINKILFMLLHDCHTPELKDKIASTLLRANINDKAIYRKELALTTNFLLCTKKISQEDIELLVKMQPQYDHLIEHFSFCAHLTTEPLNLLHLINSLQVNHSMVFDYVKTNNHLNKCVSTASPNHDGMHKPNSSSCHPFNLITSGQKIAKFLDEYFSMLTDRTQSASVRKEMNFIESIKKKNMLLNLDRQLKKKQNCHHQKEIVYKI